MIANSVGKGHSCYSLMHYSDCVSKLTALYNFLYEALGEHLKQVE